MKKLFAALAVVAAVGALGGCATRLSDDTYQRHQTMRAQNVEFGTLEAVRPVQIDGTRTGVGTTSGAVLGGIAGSTVGQGRGSVAGAVAGAVIGGVIGNAVERDATRAAGVELTVRLDTGRMIAVVQEGDPNFFRPGDRVRVLSSGGTTRVTR